MKAEDRSQVTAMILAGGRGSRMGGQDKGLVDLQGRPMIERVLRRITPQVAGIMINANRNHERYAEYGYPVIPDALPDYQGPLAGFAAGLEASPTPYIVTLPCDGPVVADDLVARLYDALTGDEAEIAVAHDGQRLQPVYALIGKTLLPSLARFIEQGDRKIDLWYARHHTAKADFSDCRACFINMNTPDDHRELSSAQANPEVNRS